MIALFDAVGLGQWFRYVTGSLEVLGALLLIVPGTTAFGAVLLACVLAGAVVTHLTVLHTAPTAPLVLFALPNERARRNDFAIELPYGASLVLRHDARAEVKGLDAFEPDRPPVAPVFFAFRVMVGMGLLMLTVAWLGAWATRRGRTAPRWLLWVFAACTFAGWIATLAGWLVTEIGRQPWLATGILRTAKAVGEASGAELGASLTGYVLTYSALLVAYLVVLTHMAGKDATARPREGDATAAVVATTS